MAPRRTTALLAATAALALPASALAQSAGDDQYNDPFAGKHHSKTTQSGNRGGGGGGSGSSAQPPLSNEPPNPLPNGSSGSQPGANPSGRQLPATGAESGLIALAGAGLLLAGVGLRLRLRSQQD
jgi:LPXTG-motif cell wall-anchored protein